MKHGGKHGFLLDAKDHVLLPLKLVPYYAKVFYLPN